MSAMCKASHMECVGCLDCECKPQTKICEECGESIYINQENYYDFHGDKVHSDCLVDFVQAYRMAVV